MNLIYYIDLFGVAVFAISGVVGGIVRDVLSREVPLIFQLESILIIM